MSGCGAVRKFNLSDHTEVELTCGGNHGTDAMHIVTDVVDGVTVVYLWPNEKATP